MLAQDILNNARQRRLLALETSATSVTQRMIHRRLARLKFPNRVGSTADLETFFATYCQITAQNEAMAQAA